MKKAVVILACVLLVALVGCSNVTINNQATSSSTSGGAAQPTASTGDSKPVKIGNVPVETIGNLASITCGDGICNNREYLSTTKMLECRSLLDSCAIDVDGQKVGTENYYICKKDCSAECDMDLDIDVCLKSEGVYDITVNDGEGNLHGYLILFRGKFPFLKYGGASGRWQLDLSNIASVIGEMQSISIVPEMRNSDGTTAECGNHEKVFTSVESC